MNPHREGHRSERKETGQCGWSVVSYKAGKGLRDWGVGDRGARMRKA